LKKLYLYYIMIIFIIYFNILLITMFIVPLERIYFIILPIFSFIIIIGMNSLIVNWASSFFTGQIKNEKKVRKILKITLWMSFLVILIWPFIIKMKNKTRSENKENT